MFAIALITCIASSAVPSEGGFILDTCYTYIQHDPLFSNEEECEDFVSTALELAEALPDKDQILTCITWDLQSALRARRIK